MKKKLLIIIGIIAIPIIAIGVLYLLVHLIWLPDTIRDKKFKSELVGIIDTVHFKMSSDKLRKLKGEPKELIVDDDSMIYTNIYQEQIYNIESEIKYEFHSSVNSALYSVTYNIPVEGLKDIEIMRPIYSNILEIYKETYEIISYTKQEDLNENISANIIAKSKIDKSKITVEIKLENNEVVVIAKNNFKWKP